MGHLHFNSLQSIECELVSWLLPTEEQRPTEGVSQQAGKEWGRSGLKKARQPQATRGPGLLGRDGQVVGVWGEVQRR